jgi:ferredoxin
MTSDPGHRFTLRLLPSEWTLPLAREATILANALAAGVSLPSSCRNGTCRTCMCMKLEGDVTYRIEWPGLSAQEKAEGYVLPCVAYPLSDVTLEQPAAQRTVRRPPE